MKIEPSPAPARIRIVHCIGTMELGGAEKQLAELIFRLPRERFEQSLVLVQGGGPLVERVREAGCEVFSLDYRAKLRASDPRSQWAFARALARFVRYLHRDRPQILHAQLYWANVLGVTAARIAGVPVVVTSRLSLSDYKSGRPLLQTIENAANRFTTAVFANSEAVRRDALAHERLDPAKIRVIHNGVVLSDFEGANPEPLRRELGVETGQLVLMAVANLHRYKGHEDLLRAAARITRRHPHVRVVLVGRDQGMRAWLETLVAELGLERTVVLAGERRDVPALLSSVADIMVHPSHEEGFCNAILEAMAAGRPVVATAVGGNAEAVRDGVDGFIVPARNPEALAAAVERLIVDPELRLCMGEAARRRIQEEFSMERMIERFAEWYESLAPGSGL